MLRVSKDGASNLNFVIVSTFMLIAALKLQYLAQ